MKKNFLLLVMMCLLGGFSSSLMAQETVSHVALGTAGKQANRIPFSTQVTYTHSQQLLTPDVIKAGNNGVMPKGKITKIAFEHYTAGTEMYCDNLSVYMIHTTLTELTTTMTKEIGDALYTGSARTNTKTNCFEITLTTPFEYDGESNILLCLDVNSKPSVYSGDANFVTTSTSTGFGNYYSCVYKNSNTTNYGPDVNTWVTGTRARYTNAMYLTFVGDEEVVIPDPNAPTLSLPGNGVENQIKPLLRFTIGENTTHYQIWMGTSEANMTEKTDWIETDKDEEIDYQTSNLKYNPATTYYWKVVARNGETDDAPTKESSVYSFTTKAITAAPAKATYTNPSNSEICTTNYPNLKWEYDETTFEYKVLVGTNEELKDDKDADGDYVANNDIKQNWTDANLASGNSYQTSGLAVGTYYWRVDVKNDEGITKGDVYSFEIPGVENISNAEASDTELTWTFDEYATQYRVLLGRPMNETDAAKDPLEVYCNYLTQFQTTWMDVPADEQGSYTLPTNDIIAGKTYYWTVEVKNFTDDKIYENYVYEYDDENKPHKVFTPEVEIYSFVTSSMSPVDNTSPKNGTKDLNNPELKWSFNNSNATYYQVYLGTDENNLTGQGWTAREKVEVGGVEEYKANGSFQTSNLTANTTYYWRVDVTDAEDPTAEGISVYEGATWSFLSHLPAPEPSANPTQIKPTYGIVYGGTTISWNILNGVEGYNVYLDENKPELTKLNPELLGASQNYYTIAPEDRMLQYNMKDDEGNGGYDIYVEAVYGTTTKKSEAVNVTVTGVGFLSVTVKDVTTPTEKNVAGATITLTQIKDEWGNTENLDVSYTFTTDENGQYLSETEGNIRPLIGTYKITVEKENYTQKDEDESIEITHNETTSKTLKLVLNIPDNVTPISPDDGATDVTSKTIKFAFAEGTEEYRFLYGTSNTSLVYCGYGTSGEWLSTNGVAEAEVEIPSISAGKTYYWAVDVRNELGARQVFGDAAPVNVYSFTANKTLPVFNTAPANGATNLTNPTLEWEYNGNANRYMVRLGESEDALFPYPDSEWKTRGEEETGSLETASLKERTKYYWRVDVLDANNNAYIGDVWSFVSHLPAPVATANPTQIVPSFNFTHGETTISWEALEDVQGYNVYLGTEQLNAEILSAEVKEFTIAANTLKLTHNMENGYDIYVEAVYELGTSMSEAVNVKVTGTGYLSATIYKNDYYNRLEGATITLSCTEDEFGNTYEEGNGRQYVLTTDSNGQYLSSTEGNERIQNGTYNVVVTKDNYTSYENELTFTNNETSELSVILTLENLFDVYLTEVDFYSVKINLGTNKAGHYHVYRKNGNSSQEYLGELEFLINSGNKSVSCVYNDWANLGKGNYLFGVSKIKDVDINWTEEVEIRNYDVFDVPGDWNTTSCWRDKVLPSENADVYVLANAIVSSEANAKNLNLQSDCSLTVEDGGALTITGTIVNNGSIVLNDGGQIFQSNENVNATFNMNMVNPTEWGVSKDGWQFISSPIQNALISQFIPAKQAQGDYDLYRYDGSQELQWVNHKNHNDFETEFVSGRGYLASYETLETATLSGYLYNKDNFDFTEVTYTEGGKFANFHLLGNPFSFDMDWSNITVENVYEAFATVDPSTGGYIKHTNGTIPVGDGFFVEAKGKNPSISYNVGSKSRGEKVEYINVIASGKQGSNNVIIKLAGKEEKGFSKLENLNQSIADIYVKNNGRQYSVLGYDKDVKEVELFFDAKEMGNYTIGIEPNGKFQSVTLVDRMTGIETNMLLDSYTFTATANDNPNRFVLKLANGQEPTANSNFVYQSGEELIVEAEGTIQIIDVMGRMVYNNDVESSNNRINVSNLKGATYIVRNITDNDVKVQKVVIY